MSEWKTVKLKDLLSYKGYIRGPFGSALRRGEMQQSGIPVYEQEHAINEIRHFRYFIDEKKYNELKRFTVVTDDIIISCSGTVGRISVIKKNDPIGIISQALLILRSNLNIVDVNYLKYFLRSKVGQNAILERSNGSVQVNICKREIIEEIPVPLPSLDTQKNIAQILSSLDDKIELNAQINHNLEEQAKALYDQIWDNYDSGTWSSAKAEDLFDISIGKTPPRKESQWFSENDNDIVWVSIADMGQSGCFISNSSEYLTPDAVSKFNVKRVPAGAILLSFKLTVGRVAITGCELTTNEAIAHFRMEDSTIREYLYFYLKHFNYQTMGSTSSIATAVNSKMVKAMRIDIPARETLENFHSTVFPMFEQIEQNQQEIQTLAQLRDTLLPKLMSGELDVSEVEV